jgi:hypothetical protein
MEKQVIRIPELSDDKTEQKGIEFTHILMGDSGWFERNDLPQTFSKIVYLGKCSVDGDLFAAYTKEWGHIIIYKGKLNNGSY